MHHEEEGSALALLTRAQPLSTEEPLACGQGFPVPAGERSAPPVVCCQPAVWEEGLMVWTLRQCSRAVLDRNSTCYTFRRGIGFHQRPVPLGTKLWAACATAQERRGEIGTWILTCPVLVHYPRSAQERRGRHSPVSLVSGVLGVSYKQS